MSLKRVGAFLVLGLFFILFIFPVLSGSAEKAEKDPAQGLKNPRSYTAHLVGHAHIDLSWLWRWEETVKDNVLRMSIVHGATAPDPEADRGPQELGYALYPHPGSWKEAGTVRRGYEFNNPLLRTVPASFHEPG